jgi:acetoin utilization protein AcuA
MIPTHHKRVFADTERGRISITSFCSPEAIESLAFKRAFGMHPYYNPIVSTKQSLIQAANDADANVTIAATDDGDIVGFGILTYPGPEERWHRVGDRLMMEVAVIEVSRPWRSMGLSRKILAMVLDHPLKEDRIYYMVGYSWTWDLDGSAMAAMDYREMMIHLFSVFGFEVLQTNEPNVVLRPENLFMARIGKNISEANQKRFKQVRFNLDL